MLVLANEFEDLTLEKWGMEKASDSECKYLEVHYGI